MWRKVGIINSYQNLFLIHTQHYDTYQLYSLIQACLQHKIYNMHFNKPETHGQSKMRLIAFPVGTEMVNSQYKHYRWRKTQ